MAKVITRTLNERLDTFICQAPIKNTSILEPAIIEAP